MNQQEKEMTPEQSLELIRHTIEQNRRSMERNAGVPMIFWGILTAVFAIAIAFLWKYCGGPIWNMLWFLMAAIGFLVEHTILENHGEKSNSFLGFVISKIWITFAIFSLSMSIVLFLLLFLLNLFTVDPTPETTVVFPITAVIILLLGVAATITGLVLKNYWITIASIISGLFGFALALIMGSSAFQMCIIAVVAVLVLVIPGIIMNSKKSQQLNP